jgi:hypothetical protein
MLTATMHRAPLRALILVALVGCGDNIQGVPDEILRAGVYAGRCASPRSGVDPATGRGYDDVRGSLLDEKLWLRSWLDDTYLWYGELPDRNLASYPTAVDYFDAMKTRATTPSGKPKDQFHFTYDTAVWVALSRSGVEASYGLQWVLVSRTPPRKLVVAFAQPGSPGAAAGIGRGAEVLTIDGVDLVAGSDVDTLNQGISPAAAGETHSFVIRDDPAAAPRTVALTSADISLTPVSNVHTLPAPNDHVGYLTFTDHVATAEKALAAAITELRDARITDLVLDIRYNGGGYLDIASELAFMIAGPDATAGKTFERTLFNDKYPTTDPVTGATLAPSPFLDKAYGFSLPPLQPLPSLGLGRVFVLTGSGTCSASESVMNGLAGIGVEVIQIGGTTCGKPYGFYPAGNCGTTYFSIQFQGINDQGFGDYADGFVPAGDALPGGEVLPGCVVADDFTHSLGDPAEARLAAALAYRDTGSCPRTALRAATARGMTDGDTVKPLWRQNRIMTR